MLKKEDELIQNKNNRFIKAKFFLDKIGYGFSSVQFINILFYMTGAGIFLIGLMNGLKSFLGTIASSYVKELTDKREISRKIISLFGLIFGFSFLFMAFAVSTKNVWLYAASFLIGSVSIVFYGDLFNNFMNKYVRKGWLSIIHPGFAFLGIIIIIISILYSGYILETIPLAGKIINIKILGETYTQTMYGYLIMFEITAFAFIISSYFLARVKISQEKNIRTINMKTYFKILFSKTKHFFKNKYLFVLSLTTIFVSVFQAMINAYMGIFVYNYYNDYWLGGFLNVAVMYAAALLVALSGPMINSKMNRNFGVVSMFVFGTILMAILPLIAVYNPYYPAIVAANILSVLGATLIGSAQSSLASRVLDEDNRNTFYKSSGMFTIIPFMILVTALSWIASQHGILNLFKIIGVGSLIIIVPLYFLIVIWGSRDYEKSAFKKQTDFMVEETQQIQQTQPKNQKK